jgi:hypothetical protein
MRSARSGSRQREIALLVQILVHTPVWVFVLFLALVRLGWLQAATRRVSRRRLAVVPLVMLALSLLGTWSSFGHEPLALAAWAGAWLAVVGAGLLLAPSRHVAYDRDTGMFTVPGSWIPLALMMGIFFTKYAVAVVRAVDAAAIASTGAALAICAVSGMLSGLFVARALRVARVARDPRGVATAGAAPAGPWASD